MAASASGTGAGEIRLGIAPIGWSNDDLLELGGDITLEQCLREARQAGYAGVEKGGKFPMDPKVLGPILEGHGLKLVSGWFSGELRHGSVEREKRRIARQLALYQALEVPVMVYAETTDTVQAAIDTPVAARPRMPDEEFKSYGDKLTELAEWLRAEGCPMTFHHHMGTVVESEREVDLLMAQDRRRRGPAVRYRAPPLRRRRRARDRAPPRPAHQSRALQGHPRGRARAPQGRELVVPQGRDRRRVHRAGRRRDRLRRGRARCSRRSATPAGSWSRPSRTRTRPTRSRWRASGMPR